MIEFLKSLKELGAFATILLGCYLAWKFILSSMFEIWLKNKLEIRKQELSIALSLEKETAVKMAEFEIVKLNFLFLWMAFCQPKLRWPNLKL